MIRTLIWFIYFWLYLIFSIPDWFRLKYLAHKGRNSEFQSFLFTKAGRWARSLVALAGAKVIVVGEENIPLSEPVLFVSNHQGYFDIPLLLGFINKPKAFIAKMETKKIPFINSWMTFMNCVFINRKNLRQSLGAVQQGIEVLKKGQSLVIFPEGTRSKSSQLGAFKPGSFKLAVETQAPIIPVAINGTYKLMEKQGLIIRPAMVRLIINPPVLPTDSTTARDLATQVKGIIKDSLKEEPDQAPPDQLTKSAL